MPAIDLFNNQKGDAFGVIVNGYLNSFAESSTFFSAMLTYEDLNYFYDWNNTFKNKGIRHQLSVGYQFVIKEKLSLAIGLGVFQNHFSSEVVKSNSSAPKDDNKNRSNAYVDFKMGFKF